MAASRTSEAAMLFGLGSKPKTVAKAAKPAAKVSWFAPKPAAVKPAARKPASKRVPPKPAAKKPFAPPKLPFDLPFVGQKAASGRSVKDPLSIPGLAFETVTTLLTPGQLALVAGWAALAAFLFLSFPGYNQ
jgi:hypothetical protein